METGYFDIFETLQPKVTGHKRNRFLMESLKTLLVAGRVDYIPEL